MLLLWATTWKMSLHLLNIPLRIKSTMLVWCTEVFSFHMGCVPELRGCGIKSQSQILQSTSAAAVLSVSALTYLSCCHTVANKAAIVSRCSFVCLTSLGCLAWRKSKAHNGGRGAGGYWWPWWIPHHIRRDSIPHRCSVWTLWELSSESRDYGDWRLKMCFEHCTLPFCS